MTYYDKIAKSYETLYLDEQLKKINIIKRYINPLPREKLLDVGCGTGISTQPWNCIRFGIDPSKKLIARARDKGKIVYKVAPAENIPFPDNFFDYVISITSIQNFSNIEKSLAEIKRVGKERYIFSVLKRSLKIKFIQQDIMRYFNVKRIIEEEKDMIFMI